MNRNKLRKHGPRANSSREESRDRQVITDSSNVNFIHKSSKSASSTPTSDIDWNSTIGNKKKLMLVVKNQDIWGPGR